MQGERFVQLLEQQSLDALLSHVAAAHPAVTLSILLEGLHSYLRQAPEHADPPSLPPSQCAAMDSMPNAPPWTPCGVKR